MSLPARQQQKLDGIESRLRSSAPQLVAMFAIFTRLTDDEEPARTERIRPSRWRIAATTVRDATLVVIAVAMIVVGVVVGETAYGAVGCASGHVVGGRSFTEVNCAMRQRVVIAK
jgi:hypothetical protein